MIERVARALCEASKMPPIYPQEVDQEWPSFKSDAITVLTAMREPTKAMLLDGADTLPERSNDSLADNDAEAVAEARGVWRAMIDAALEDGRT